MSARPHILHTGKALVWLPAILLLVAAYVSPAGADPSRVLVIENPVLSGMIDVQVNRYLSDVTEVGFQPELYVQDFTTPEALKAFIKSKYDQGNLAGVVLIGRFPCAFYELQGQQAFQCDLFYCDLWIRIRFPMLTPATTMVIPRAQVTKDPIYSSAG